MKHTSSHTRVAFSEASLSISPEVLPAPLAELGAHRLLRLAAGQIFLARIKADEVISDISLEKNAKHKLCEAIGKDLNSWFRLAVSGISSEHKGGPMVELLERAASFSINAQFFGQDWFTNGNPQLLGSWCNFEAGPLAEIVDSIAENRAGKKILIAEFQLSTLTPSLRDSLVEILKSWRIDDRVKTMQLGLEWTVSSQELLDYLKRDSAIIFIRMVDGKPKGVNITFTDIETSEDITRSLPSAGGAKASKLWCKEHGVQCTEVMYDYLVAMDKHESSDTRLGGYRLTLDATEQSASWLNKKYILGGVRIDSDSHSGNSAIKIHEAVGWHKEPLEFRSGLTGATLTLISRPVPSPESFTLRPIKFAIPELTGGHSHQLILGDPAKLAEKDKSDLNAIRDSDSAKHYAKKFFETNWHDNSVKIVSNHGNLSGGQHGVGIWLNNIQFYFYQVRPNQDLWMNRDSGQVASFSDGLHLLSLELNQSGN